MCINSVTQWHDSRLSACDDSTTGVSSSDWQPKTSNRWAHQGKKAGSPGRGAELSAKNPPSGPWLQQAAQGLADRGAGESAEQGCDKVSAFLPEDIIYTCKKRYEESGNLTGKTFFTHSEGEAEMILFIFHHFTVKLFQCFMILVAAHTKRNKIYFL